MFDGPSIYANQVDSVMLYILAISVFLLVGITGVLIYFVYKYNEKRHPKPQQTHGNIYLETVWIVIPTIIVISMFYYGWIEYKEVRNPELAENRVQVRGAMWKWTFEYDNGFVIDSLLYVPNNTMTKLDVVSMDVLHSFYMPAFRIKEDAVPKNPSYILFKPEVKFEEGEISKEFQVQCAEYCGKDHSYMNARVVVMREDEYLKWFEKNKVKAEEPVKVAEPVALSEAETEAVPN